MVIGLGDRALGREACVPWTWRTAVFAPRVIPIQNRMRLTQLPGREAPKYVPWQPQDAKRNVRQVLVISAL